MTVDFVEDDARLARGQPRVALHPSAQLALHVRAAVVEHRPRRPDVKLLVGVATHARRAGGLNVHQRRSVGGAQDGGTLLARGGGVGDDLGLNKRCTQACERPCQGHRPCYTLASDTTRAFALSLRGF